MKTWTIITWSVLAIVLVFAILASFLILVVSRGGDSLFSSDYKTVAKISIQGEIVADDAPGLFGDQRSS